MDKLLVILNLVFFSFVSYADNTQFDWNPDFDPPRCTEYTLNWGVIQNVDLNICRKLKGVKLDWNTESDTTRCTEYTNKWKPIRNLSLDICRKLKLKETYYTDVTSGLSEQVDSGPALKIEEINRLLRFPESSQVVLNEELIVPRNQGCAAPQDTKGEVQCFVCQAQSSRNTMLYTKLSVLPLGAAQMLDARNEIRIGLIDSDDLGAIRCLSKNKQAIRVTKIDDLIQFLKDSGIQYKEPSAVVRTIRPTAPAVQTYDNFQGYEP